MKSLLLFLRRVGATAFILFLVPAFAAEPPIALHPDNPHYFLWRGKPTILITSAEHYGAVLNRDFDTARYLAALSRDKLNLTRTFTGVYFEKPGDFKIERNTLAPAPDRHIGPWKRVTPGAYDLSQWDDEYFDRLVKFVNAAGREGIVVELALFCPFYDESQWVLSPMNPKNNLQKAGPSNREHVYTLDKHAGLLAYHDALTRKLVSALREADNLIYELCNEPYFGGVTLDWQHHIAETIAEAEASFPHRHLISRNVANGKAKIESPHRSISVFNFHYATPPEAVALNYELNLPIGDNETGFKGTQDRHYRMEGWEFIVAGGALYNNLDYSFAVGHEDGSLNVKDPTPGGGGARFRAQMRILHDFISEFDILKMKPAPETVRAGVPDKARVQVLAQPGKQYALYLTSGGRARLTLNLPAGRYSAQWIDPLTGSCPAETQIDHSGGDVTLESPPYSEDIALKVLAR